MKLKILKEHCIFELLMIDKREKVKYVVKKSAKKHLTNLTSMCPLIHKKNINA